MKKFKQKTKTQEDYLKEVEAINYQTSLEAQKTLNSIIRTTDKTTNMIHEQREKLEDIHRESNTVRENLEKGKKLSIKMKRAGKLIVIGDKISDKISNLFSSSSKPKANYALKTAPPQEKSPQITEPLKIEEEPTEQSTNEVLLSIRNGLKTLRKKLTEQNTEIKNQLPLIEDITETNTQSTEDASKVMKNLRKM